MFTEHRTSEVLQPCCGARGSAAEGAWGSEGLTADEAGRLQDLLFLLLLTPQVRKGVDDDSKDEVEDNDDDHEEEQQVINDPRSKQGFLERRDDIQA